MSYIIGSDMHIYDDNGERLPRTEVAKLIDTINANFSRPVSVYLMSDLAQTELKVGIADDVSKRRYQHEYDRGFAVQVLYATAAIDRAAAGKRLAVFSRWQTTLFATKRTTMQSRAMRMVHGGVMSTVPRSMGAMSLHGSYPTVIQQALSSTPKKGSFNAPMSI